VKQDKARREQAFFDFAKEKGLHVFSPVADSRWASGSFVEEDEDNESLDGDDSNVLLQGLKNYLDLAKIAKKFVTFDMQAVREIWYLQDEVKAVATAARDQAFKINFENDRLDGPGIDGYWFIDSEIIEYMTEPLKSKALTLARADIAFLRKERVDLQKLVFDRLDAVQSGGALPWFTYPNRLRPTDIALAD
jgi:hypothetical protein